MLKDDSMKTKYLLEQMKNEKDSLLPVSQDKVMENNCPLNDFEFEDEFVVIRSIN